MSEERGPEEGLFVDSREEEIRVPEGVRRRLALGTGRRRVALWGALLAVYLFLFAATGYLAFFSRDTVPGAERYDQIIRIEDAEDKAFIKEVMAAEDSEHRKRKDLAMQAFNVVLGALLGFLSASASSMLEKEEEEKE